MPDTPPIHPYSEKKTDTEESNQYQTEDIPQTENNLYIHSTRRTVQIEVLRQLIIISGAIVSIPAIEYLQREAGSVIDLFPKTSYYIALLGLYPFLYPLAKNHYKSLKETDFSTSNVLATSMYSGLKYLNVTPEKLNLLTAATIGTLTIPLAFDLLTTLGSQITAFAANLFLENMPPNLDVKLFLGATFAGILASMVQSRAVKAETVLHNRNFALHREYLLAGFKEMLLPTPKELVEEEEHYLYLM